MPTTLFLMVTYGCNLRCRYCLVSKKNEWMRWTVAKKALDAFFNLAGEPASVRIFGGEPLLDFPLVKRILAYVLERRHNGNAGLHIDITTNGTLLDENIMRFFEDHRQVELIVSLDGMKSSHVAERIASNGSNSFAWVSRYTPRLSKLPNVTVNKVISPRNVGALLRDFHFIFRLGFRRVNLLPAYFNVWSDSELELLDTNLGRLVELVRYFWKSGVDLYIKNLDVVSESPLFSDGILIDPNGEAYSSNVVISSLFEKHKALLRIGHVLQGDLPGASCEANLNELTADLLDPALVKSTLRADQALSRFVRELFGQAIATVCALQARSVLG